MTTPSDMLANWPGWDRKTADELIASPAWAMRVRWGDAEMRMRFAEDAPRDVIGLRIAFDGEEHFLGLGNRASFPDLNALWAEKKRLPDALVLALVEKECGNLLQLLENAVRAQLTVIGLADPEARASARGFEVTDAKGTRVAFFSMTVSPLVKEAFGDVSHIDTSHPEIRALEMPAAAEYASFLLNDAEAAGLAPGDCLLLPEAEGPAPGRWIPQGVPADGRFHVVADAPGTLAFGALADGVLPEVPPPGRLALVRDGKTLAVGSFCRLGIRPAFAVEEVL